MEAFGAPAEFIEACAAAKRVEEFEVFEEGQDALLTFLRMQTQWQVTQGHVVGLNYQALQFVMQTYGIDEPRDVLEHIQAMELAALEILNARTE